MRDDRIIEALERLDQLLRQIDENNRRIVGILEAIVLAAQERGK